MKSVVTVTPSRQQACDSPRLVFVSRQRWTTFSHLCSFRSSSCQMSSIARPAQAQARAPSNPAAVQNPSFNCSHGETDVYSTLTFSSISFFSPICLEIFREPLQLPCQHTFCKLCLERITDDRWGRCKCSFRFCSLSTCRTLRSRMPWMLSCSIRRCWLLRDQSNYCQST